MHIHPSSPNSSSSLQSEEECAAIKIQAGFRGYRVRKQLHHQPQTRCTNTNGYHAHHHRHSHRSASHRRRHQQQQQQHSAMEQQQHQSNGSVTSSAGDINGAEGASIEDRCATKIQAGVRGFLVRKKQKIATDAATKIQAGFRGFKVRKETQKLKQK